MLDEDLQSIPGVGPGTASKLKAAGYPTIESVAVTPPREIMEIDRSTIGAISDVKFEDAGDFYVPNLNVSLPQFWKIAHDISIEPEEKPLLVVRPYNLDIELTYPPSCVFFGEQSLKLP